VPGVGLNPKLCLRAGSLRFRGRYPQCLLFERAVNKYNGSGAVEPMLINLHSNVDNYANILYVKDCRFVENIEVEVEILRT
jgi:hypothetical protein